LAATAAKDHYDANKAAYAIPEQARVEFIVFSQAQLEDQVSVTTEDVQAWYNAHQDQYRQPEQRRASHILIATPKGSPEAEIAVAKKKAEDVLAQVQAKAAAFAALAKQYSQDPGSASKGGDLDWFGRGAMVKSFEDAAFAMKEGELSGIVRSDFGFHIIKLTGIQPEKIKTLDEVRGDITRELRSQAAARKYAELAEGFSNTVYEQPDSLAPAAEKFKLKIEQSNWVAKGAIGKDLLNNPKLMSALFSDDTIKNKRNTEAVEVAPKTLVSARIAEYRAASVRPFDEVRADIEKKLTLEEAGKLSRKEGEAKLAGLLAGDASDLNWGPTRSVPRLGAQDFPPAAAKAVFQANVTKLPAYAGIPATGGGYALYRITQVKPFAGGDDPRAKALRQQYERVVQGEEFSAWLAALRKRYPVEINSKAFEAKDR
jgi:peptidyl-prolyl cis-trans isomerase D